MGQFVTQEDTSFVFEGNNFRWHQSTTGHLFYHQENGRAGLEVPKDGNNHSVFAHALWIGGMKGDNPVATFSYFCQNGECIEKWGPLDDNHQTTHAVAENYKRFWFVTREEIDVHLGFFHCAEDPACNPETEYPGYQMPEAFETWPAHGPEGYAEYLAPFFDYNDNGVYDPENGDHPVICGDFSTYQITNDVGSENSWSWGDPLGVEIHTRVYGYNATEGALFNTLFVQHKIINRSPDTFTNAHFGTFTDFDLGDPMDDFVGTDVMRSMYLAYNGTQHDFSSWAGPGYGSDLPIMGVRYLGGPLMDADGVDNPRISESYETYAHQTESWGDGIVDNERWGLTSSLYFGSGPLSTGGQANTPEHVLHWMSGNWGDGSPRTYGGYGYNSDSDVAAKYFMPGDSDPLWVGTDGIDPNYPHEGGWTEENEGNPPGDRRMFGSTGPFTFNPGDAQYFDYAMIFARQSHNPDMELRDILNQYADEIVGMECEMLPNITTAVDDPGSEIKIGVYPNPADDELTVISPLQRGTYTLFDLEGRRVMQGTLAGPRTAISVKNLSPGMYLLHVQGDEGVGVEKVLVE